MVKRLKKNTAKILALTVAVIMVLCLLPISELIMAQTTNHPETVTITVVDENDDPVTGATVTYKVYSATDLVFADSVAVDGNGDVVVMTKADFDANTAGDLFLTATATADGYAPAEVGGSIDVLPILLGTESYTITLKEQKPDIDNVSVEKNTNEADLVYSGSAITLVTISAIAGDTVEVKVNNEAYAGYPKNLEADDNNIKITATDAGEYTVYVKITRAGYVDFEETYLVTITPKTIEGITLEGKTLNYNGQPQQIVTFGGTQDGDDVYWKIGNDDWDKQAYDYIPERVDVSSYEVSVRVVRNGGNEVFESAEPVISVINLGLLDLTGLDISTATGLTYNKNNQDLLVVNAKPDEYKLSFITSDGYSSAIKDNADVNWTDWTDVQVPQGKNAGKYTVWVKVSRDENYEEKQPQDNPDTEEKEYPFYIEIAKADITGVTVTPYEGTYDTEAHDAVVSVDGTVDGDSLTYSKDGQSFSDEMPSVTDVNDSGTYYVKVHRDDNYNDLTLDPEVVIDKADQDIAFVVVPNELYYNFNNKFTYAISPESIGANAQGDITYELITDNDGTTYAAATIDAATGEVTYTSVGHITVKATIAECDNYNSDDEIYNVDIVYIESPEYDMTEPLFVQKGEDDAFICNWYNGIGITIAKEGWTVSKGSNAVDSVWAASVSETEEGDYTGYTVAFKDDETGNITDLIEIPRFAIDTTAPTLQATDKENSQYGVVFEQENKGIIAKLLNFLEFGTFFNKELKVTVNAADSASGIDNAQYKIHFVNSEKASVYESEWQSEKVFAIPDSALDLDNFKGLVYVAIEDNVGNQCEEIQVNTENSNWKNTNFMIENDVPVISYELVQEPYSNGIIDIYNGNFEIDFSVNDVPEGNPKNVSGVNYVEAKVKVYDENDQPSYLSVLESDYSTDTKVNDNVSFVIPVVFDFDKNTVTINGKEKTIQEVFAKEDGKFELTIYAVDNSGNVPDEETVVCCYLDHKSPEIAGFEFATESIPGFLDVSAGTNGLYKAVDVTDYGFYFKENVTVTITAVDNRGENQIASGVKSITYCAIDVNGETVVSGTDLVNENNQVSFTIEKDFKGQIYAFATDYLGNTPTNQDSEFDFEAEGVINDSKDALYGYVHPNGSILETEDHHNEEPEHIAISLPDTKYTQEDGKKLYEKDVVVNFVIKDEYAGIRYIEWSVNSENDTKENYSSKLTVGNDGSEIEYEGTEKTGITWSNDTNEDTKAINKNLVTEMSINIPVSNNSNDITVKVKLTDRAGNTSEDEIMFGIDKTNPVIKVSYDDKTPDEHYTEYFKDNRTATISITERNFDPSRVNITVTKDGAAKGTAVSWTTDDPKAYEPTHTATITYNQDGDYTFDITCTDRADNSNDSVDYGTSISPTKFTVDKTLPRVDVSYNNNDARNVNYYKASRTATITVTEHNFDPARVEITNKSASEAAFPALSSWTAAGDVYTATLDFTADSLYKFDVVVTDKAGNVDVDNNAQEFTVDKTNPVLRITGVADESANANEGNIGFTVSATDTNFDIFETVLTAVRYKDGEFSTSRVNIGYPRDIANGKQYVVNNIDTDGIYRITATLIDKAGNAFSEVILQDASGVEYAAKRSGDDVLLTFSVNREGSVFYVDGNTKKLFESYYVQNVTDDVVINEINTDILTEKSITINGDRVLAEDKDYTVSLNKDNGSWCRYTYVIKKSVFEKEGEYNIVVSSTDKAENKAFSDIKNVTAKFVVDRTAPVVTIVGLKNGGRYRTNKQVVTVIPKDDGGQLKKLIIRTVDKNGKEIDELLSLEGDALLDAIEAGSITFELGEGLYQNVEVICEDVAGNIIGDGDSGELYKNISISTNAFLIFWANKVARYLTIAGIVIVISGGVALLLLKKKKASK